jgi:hypothetical protein
MIILMLVAFWILVASQLMPKRASQIRLFQPPLAIGASAAAGLLLYLLFGQPDISLPRSLGLEQEVLRDLLSYLSVIAISIAALGLAAYFKPRPIAASVVTSLFVIAGMWLERWNIIVPTMTHPYLIAYARYQPTTTEIALTVASIALFIFMFAMFFKLFPVISIWEVVEGRVIEETLAKNVVPMPRPSNVIARKRGYRRLKGE